METIGRAETKGARGKILARKKRTGSALKGAKEKGGGSLRRPKGEFENRPYPPSPMEIVAKGP